jgi:hypothetical protein
MPQQRVDSGLHDGAGDDADAWEGFSDDSADEDQLWAERDEWHQWRNRIDSQVSGALGTSTAPSAMGRFARLKTKRSKADRANPLEFGPLALGALLSSRPSLGLLPAAADVTPRSLASDTGSKLAARSHRTLSPTSRVQQARQAQQQQQREKQQAQPQQELARQQEQARQQQAFLDSARFDGVVEPSSRKKSSKNRRDNKSGGDILDPLAQAKRAQLRKLDAARWERRGDRTQFLAQFKERPSYQNDVLDAARKTGAGPVVSQPQAVAAAARLHGTATMAQLVARKMDPSGVDPKQLAERVEEAKAAEKARVAHQRHSQAAAVNFGASVNILARQTHSAQTHKARSDQVQQVVSQTKFRRRKQQLSRRKMDE